MSKTPIITAQARPDHVLSHHMPAPGDVYEDGDLRMNGRHIELVTAFEKSDAWNRPYPAFKVRVIVPAESNPDSVGRLSAVSQANLLRRFRWVAAGAPASS